MSSAAGFLTENHASGFTHCGTTLCPVNSREILTRVNMCNIATLAVTTEELWYVSNKHSNVKILVFTRQEYNGLALTTIENELEKFRLSLHACALHRLHTCP